MGIKRQMKRKKYDFEFRCKLWRICTQVQRQISRGATAGVLKKKVFLEISQNPQESTCASLFLSKVAGLRFANLLKKRL